MEFIDKELYKGKHGIYRITNIETGYSYIGQTTQDFNRRFLQHKERLESNRSCNDHMQRSYNKHGTDKFIFEVIEIVEDDSTLNFLENKYITETKLCYNILPGGGAEMHKALGELNKKLNTGKKASEKTKRKMSESRKGKPNPGGIVAAKTRAENFLNGKVNGLNTLTADDVRKIKIELMKDVKSQTEIAKEFNVVKGTISAIMNNRSWTFVEVEGWDEFVAYCKTTPWRQRKANARTTDKDVQTGR